ncbi:MAG TPA: phytanoyl-CoA dioxygenase family protein [Woeseiaceae bacterium]|nr:phytanoyl-CoA dioxygenase family protein [Woeseiaceae bacterium]
MTHIISEDIIQQYERDGAVCIRGAVSKAHATDLLGRIDMLISGRDDRWTTDRTGGFSDRHLWPEFPWIYEFCANTELPAIAGRLMQSSFARLFFDHIFIRDAGTAHATPWHQDRPYWPFQGRQIASVWVALAPCKAASSGLRFIRGSHAWGKTFQPVGFGEKSPSASFLGSNGSFEPMPDFDAETDRYEILSWDMQAGDAIVFGAETVHGAASNTGSAERRAAISIRYVGDDARWDPRPGTDPIVTQDKVSTQPGDAPRDDTWFPEVWHAAA